MVASQNFLELLKSYFCQTTRKSRTRPYFKILTVHCPVLFFGLETLQRAQSFKSGLNKKPSDSDNLLTSLAPFSSWRSPDITMWCCGGDGGGGGTDVRCERSSCAGLDPDTHIWEQLRVESDASSQLTLLSTAMTADYNQLITASSCGFTLAYCKSFSCLHFSPIYL